MLSLCNIRYFFFYIASGTAPEFLHKVKVTEGEEMILKVEISGDSAPDMCWYKDGKEVKQSNGVKV